MKKILIYSETLLLLKGIDQLLKEGISDIHTEQVHTVELLKKHLYEKKSNLFILHLDFSTGNPDYLAKHIIELQIEIPLLILTDDTSMAQKLFLDNMEGIYFLDIRNTVAEITQMAVRMLNSGGSHTLSL